MGLGADRSQGRQVSDLYVKLGSVRLILHFGDLCSLESQRIKDSSKAGLKHMVEVGRARPNPQDVGWTGLFCKRAREQSLSGSCLGYSPLPLA